MKKRLKIMLICMAILFGGILLWKLFMGFMFKRYMANNIPVATVSAMKVGYANWQPKLVASGSVNAINGVNVTTQIAGMITSIEFNSGQMVEANAVLVRLNADAELGQLRALEANAELAKITYQRDKAQYAVEAVSKQTIDSDEQNLKSLVAQVAQQTAIVDKKTIRAPFSGRIGIRNIHVGQFLNPGDKIATLTTIDPIYVDFYIPQQSLSQIQLNQPITVTTPAFPGKKFSGKITSIDTQVDPNTRNIEIEATVLNPTHELVFGMFSTVEVIVGKGQNFLTLPQTAVTFNSYGNIVYVLQKTDQKKNDLPVFIARQSFVTTGETRGDQITILKGLKAGDYVVTSGQLKLKNDSHVTINNSIVPANNPAPQLPDER